MKKLERYIEDVHFWFLVHDTYIGHSLRWLLSAFRKSQLQGGEILTPAVI